MFSKGAITQRSSWSLVRPNVKSYKHCAMGCTDSVWSSMCVYVLRVSWVVVSVVWKRPFNIASSSVLDGRSASWSSWYKVYGSNPPSCQCVGSVIKKLYSQLLHSIQLLMENCKMVIVSFRKDDTLAAE